MIDHIEINVKDLNESKVFYQWLLKKLGYSDYQDWDQGFSLKFNGTYIVFVQAEPDFFDYSYQRKRIGLNHLAFKSQDSQTVDCLRKELKEKGIRLLYDDRYPYAGGPYTYAVFFEDPDGIKLELVYKEGQ